MEGLNPSDSKTHSCIETQSHPKAQLDGTDTGQNCSIGKSCEPTTSHPAEHDDANVDTVLSSSTGSSDSDSDDEDTNLAMGYAPLSQDPELDYENEDDDTCLSEPNESDTVVDLSIDTSHHKETVQSDVHIEQTSRKGSGCACSPLSQLEDNQVDKIKKAMSGFTLPSSVIPEWAKQVPENVWKSELINGLRTKTDEKQSR